MAEMQKLSIRDLLPNPFQSRQAVDPDEIKAFAQEIKEKGFWGSALRARQVNGKYELVYGHRRFEALKQVGIKLVELEVVELDDTGMAEDSLVENVQRMGLADMDKAEAIVKLWELKSGKDFVHEGVSIGRNGDRFVTEIATRLGYSVESILQFMRMVRMEYETKEAVRIDERESNVADLIAWYDETIPNVTDLKVLAGAMEIELITVGHLRAVEFFVYW